MMKNPQIKVRVIPNSNRDEVIDGGPVIVRVRERAREAGRTGQR